ncbi:MAG: undecaprenyl-diphosphate phosphatase [Clostridia bacterium]|nr:undecaprenyl-diphosphate phosphatase [Clostridia bacterium]
MGYIEAIVLGFVQGATEFLPVSSSGHIMLAARLFGVEVSRSFSVCLHVATLLAVLFRFRKSVAYLLLHPKDKRAVFLITASIPTFILALLYKLFMPQSLENLLLPIGFALTIAALLLIELKDGRDRALKLSDAHAKVAEAEAMTDISKDIAAQKTHGGASLARDLSINKVENGASAEEKSKVENRVKAKSANKRRKLSDDAGWDYRSSDGLNLNIWKSFIVGAVQGCAVLCGLSRSGSTICALAYCGTRKDRRGEFSFLLSIPVIIASALSEVVFADEPFSVDIALLGASMAVALLTGILAINVVLKLIEKKKLYFFGIYLLIPLLLSIIII